MLSKSFASGSKPGSVPAGGVLVPSSSHFTNPRVSAGPVFPPSPVAGFGQYRSSPEIPVQWYPVGFHQGVGFTGQASGFRSPFPPGSGYTGCCGHSTLGRKGQPEDGSGYQKYPSSYGPSPYMSGCPPGGCGGTSVSFGQGGKPQTQAGHVGQLWGHSQPAGLFPFPQGFGLYPMGFPSWNPWGLVSL
ncbi:uncharacterized protein LOC132563881 [Ylistrum balloti]|uniref:uncharacterized protein LOC132563881 n=1 Tax=Ylistrum balloti TaxID=509963 RepID=UPI002905DB28|nr:uncharacterized protein LOC132563881 [Ylistrum balloti]